MAAAAAVIAAAVVRGHAAHVAAAAEQDEQDDDPQTVVAAEAVVVAHKITSRIGILERLHRSFHVIPKAGFGYTRQARGQFVLAGRWSNDTIGLSRLFAIFRSAYGIRFVGNGH